MPTNRTAESRWVAYRARLIRTRPHVCHYCKRALDPKAPANTPAAIEIDHFISYRDNPALQFDPDNTVLACHPCNRRKGARSWVPTTDVHGMTILDPTVRCRVHNPILTSCPHSGTLR